MQEQFSSNYNGFFAWKMIDVGHKSSSQNISIMWAVSSLNAWRTQIELSLDLTLRVCPADIYWRHLVISF